MGLERTQNEGETKRDIREMSEKKEDKTWQEELIEKYPKLLEHSYPSVGEGWKDLLDNMLGQIQHHMIWHWENECHENRVIVQDGEEPPEDKEWIQQPFFVQIKEKFGSLRAYYYGGDERIRGIVDATEGMSHKICERCGDKGYATKDGWIKILCEKHHEEDRIATEKRHQEIKEQRDARNTKEHNQNERG